MIGFFNMHEKNSCCIRCRSSAVTEACYPYLLHEKDPGMKPEATFLSFLFQCQLQLAYSSELSAHPLLQVASR